jgi:MFS family permease
MEMVRKWLYKCLLHNNSRLLGLSYFKVLCVLFHYQSSYLAVIVASILAFMGPFSHSIINPACENYAINHGSITDEDFLRRHTCCFFSHHSTTSQLYNNNCDRVCGDRSFSVGSLLFYRPACLILKGSSLGPSNSQVPLANVYGRRPVYLFGTFVSIAAVAGAGAAQSYGTLLVARACHGFFSCTAMALGAVSNFFSSIHIYLIRSHVHRRLLLIFSASMNEAEHSVSSLSWSQTVLICPLYPGESPSSCYPKAPANSIYRGYLALLVGWRWDFRLSAILLGVMFVIMLVAMPETLYRRGPSVGHATGSRPMRSVVVERLHIWGYHDVKHKLHAKDFIRPLQMYELH